MSCFERGNSKFLNTSYTQPLSSDERTSCIEPTVTSEGSPMTKATSTSHLSPDAAVVPAGKKSHCRPHITTEADELNDLLEEALTTTRCNTRWIKNPLKSHAPSPVYSPSGMKFHHLSTSNYEKAREIDMNFAEIDMETFNSNDIDIALRLAHSSPINDSMIRLCGDTEGSCILMNSLYYPMDRSKESLFKDEMLFSRTGEVDSFSERMMPKSCLMNLSITSSDSFDNSEDENKELVNKCNTTDKTQYTIAFDSNESRFGHNMVASSNFDHLTSSIYNCAKYRMEIGENGNTESPPSTDATYNTTTGTTESDDTLSYHTLSYNSPHSTLSTHSSNKFHEGNSFLPIYDLKASSISPDFNHHTSTGTVHQSQRNVQCIHEKTCEQQDNRQNRLNCRPPKVTCQEMRDSSLSNLNCQQSLKHQTPMNQGPSHLRTSSTIISPCSLLPSHDMLQHHQQQILTLSPHLPQLYENRLKHASPIREENEPSTDSSLADVEMISDSEKGTPSSTSDSSPLAPHGKSSVFGGTIGTTSRSGQWSSSQVGSELSSDVLTNRSEMNRNRNLRMSSGFISNISRQVNMPQVKPCDLPRQNMAEWLKKTSIMSSPRGFYRPGGSEPLTPVTGVGTYQMCPGYAFPPLRPPPLPNDHHLQHHHHHHHQHNHHHMAATRSPSSVNYSCVSHHQAHYLAEGRCCFAGHSTTVDHNCPRVERRHADNSNVEQASPCKDTIYVCYPNYSLPDLSFLKSPNVTTPIGDVCLSPTKPLVRPVPCGDRPSNRSVSSSNASTSKSTPKIQPKSLNDVGNLSKSTLAKVKDWESISFLLSPQVKAILGAKGLVPPSKGAPSIIEKKSQNTCAAFAPVHQVKLRNRSTALSANKSKRYSLQEPVQVNYKSPAMYSGNHRVGLVRSETLPTEDAGYFASDSGGHCHLSHPNCVIPGDNNCCCHLHSSPSCCHRRGVSLCCESPLHRQSLINRENYIETLKDLLTMQDVEREVGQMFSVLSPSLEKKVLLTHTGQVSEDKCKTRSNARPSKMILKSPGECKPTVPPKPSALGASPRKFKSFIPVPKSPAPKCSTLASKVAPTSPKVPCKPLVKASKPLTSQKKLSK